MSWKTTAACINRTSKTMKLGLFFVYLSRSGSKCTAYSSRFSVSNFNTLAMSPSFFKTFRNRRESACKADAAGTSLPLKQQPLPEVYPRSLSRGGCFRGREVPHCLKQPSLFHEKFQACFLCTPCNRGTPTCAMYISCRLWDLLRGWSLGAHTAPGLL